jgi:GNAT superfamily N-acetyltransferase
MLAADLPAVVALGDAVHGSDFFEPAAVFIERLRLFPAGCCVAGDPLCAYAIAHPWHLATPPALGTMLLALPADADCLYLHDAVVAPAARNARLGSALVLRLRALARAHGLAALALTAVRGSASYWARHGFTAGASSDATYGSGAVRMAAQA